MKNPDFPPFCLKNKKKATSTVLTRSPNVSMVSTLGAQMCQWFPHLEPKRVNGFRLGAQTRQWSPHLSLNWFTVRECTEIVLDTIDTFGLQMWKPLTHLGSQCGNHWHIWAPKVETIDTFGLHVSTVKVALFLFFRQKEGKSGIFTYE